jgi:signal transduction histidine kinase
MRFKRTQNFVDSSVQGALLRRIFLHWCTFFFVTLISIVLMQTLLGDPAKTVLDRLKFELGEYMFIGIVLLALFPAFMLDTIRFSNRFVGPIVRLRRHIRDLGGQHNTDHCVFRDNDFWTEVAAEYNKVADLVKSQQEEIESLKQQLHGDAATTSR